MPLTNTVTYTFNRPPDPVGGRARFNLQAAANEYVHNVRVVVTGSRNAASATLVVATSPDLAGPQRVEIAWALAPVPGSTISFRVEWDVLTNIVGRVILFEHIHFGGQQLVVDNASANLMTPGFNDKVSSLEVKRGAWMFYKDINFQNPFTINGAPVLLGPGLYHWVEYVGIGNDTLSSLKSL